MKALYNLQYDIAGHDYFTWLVTAKALGATSVVYQIDNPKETKWNRHVVMERFRSIISPGTAFAGLSGRLAKLGETFPLYPYASPHMVDFVTWLKCGGKFERLTSVKPAAKARFTVTLRNDKRITSMNSNIATWRRFAKEIGAVVIEDYDDVDLHIHDKMALYAGAELNFGVVNGPMHLCTLSPYPCVLFKAHISAKNLERHGIPYGSQFPWLQPNQYLVWAEDTYDNVRRWFDGWVAGKPYDLERESLST